MGLTIHYRYRFDGSRDELRERLETITGAVDDLPEDVEVPGLFHFTAGELKSGRGIGLGPDGDDRETVREYYRGSVTTSLSGVHGSEYRLPGGAWQDERPDTDGRMQMRWLPGEDAVVDNWEAFVMPVWVMPGCEPFQIVLGRPEDGDEWMGRGFTKTQYAEDFLKAHLTVITMLDMVDAAGMLEDVSDEGDYWEDRDLSALTDSIQEYKVVVEGLGSVLSKLGNEAGFDVKHGGNTNTVL